MQLKLLPALLLVAGLAFMSESARALDGEHPPPSRDAPALQDKIEELQRRIEGLERQHREEIDSLKKRIEELRRTSVDDSEDLLSDIESLEETVSRMRAEAQAPTSQRLNVFNPRITVFGNFIGRIDDRKIHNEEGDRIDDQFNLREVELDFRAAIDPWADGVMIVTLESEFPGEYETTVEEGYVVLKRLPVLDTAPLGLKLKVGRFRPAFGRLNRIHLHDLPQVEYPRSVRTFLGEEGFVQNGLSGSFFVPVPGESHAVEATLQFLNGGDLPVGGENEANDPAGLGRVKWFWEMAAGHDLEIGASGYHAENDRRTDLYGVDLTYRWRPFEHGEWRSFLLGGEVFYADLEKDDGERHPFGGYVWSQYQFDKNIFLGARYDYAEEIDDEDLATHTAGLFLTYYTTEFLRLRVGYERVVRSDVAERDDLDSLLFELNFVFGSHPVEPYWVNR